MDNRTLKASLGTTKYCSHFLKSTYCPKVDCMYLHDFGEDAASFTKEEMSQGYLSFRLKYIYVFFEWRFLIFIISTTKFKKTFGI